MSSLSAIYHAAKAGELPAYSQHFSQAAYDKAFILLASIEESSLPSGIKSALLARMDDYYDQIVKAKDVSPTLGRTVSKAVRQYMFGILSYLRESTFAIVDDHILAVSIWQEIGSSNDYATLMQGMRTVLTNIQYNLEVMCYELEK